MPRYTKRINYSKKYHWVRTVADTISRVVVAFMIAILITSALAWLWLSLQNFGFEGIVLIFFLPSFVAMIALILCIPIYIFLRKINNKRFLTGAYIVTILFFVLWGYALLSR